jgi:curved DNA-binding protein CbpA
VIPELLFLALEFYREPRRHEALRDPRAPLPPGIAELLAAPANCLADDEIAATAAKLSATEDDCRACVPFFIKQVMLEVGGDYYRTLGLGKGAEQAQVKEHYFYLMRMFHPDKDVNNEGWDDLYAPRINEAYNTLRNPGKRAAYDATLAPDDSFGPGVLTQAEQPAFTPPPAAPASRPAPAVPGMLRSPWFYGFLVLASVLLLLGFLKTSNETSQLTVTAKPAAVEQQREVGGYTSLGEVRADFEQPANAPQPEAPSPAEPEAYYEDITAEDERIEAMVEARVNRATRAVLGRPRAKSRPVQKPVAVAAQPVSVAHAPVERAPQPAKEVVSELPPAEPEPAPQQVAVEADAPERLEPAPEPEPEPESEPVAAVIDNAQLEQLLMRFAEHYLAGDSAAFAALFAADARTTDANGRGEIQRLYADFFADNIVDRVRFEQVAWDGQADAERRGTAAVLIATRPRDGNDAAAVQVTIRFEVTRNAAGNVQISRMSY